MNKEINILFVYDIAATDWSHMLVQETPGENRNCR